MVPLDFLTSDLEGQHATLSNGTIILLTARISHINFYLSRLIFELSTIIMKSYKYKASAVIS